MNTIEDDMIDGIRLDDPHFTLKHMYRIPSQEEAGEAYINRMLEFFKDHPYIPEKDSYTKFEFAHIMFKHDMRLEMTGYHFNADDEEFSNLTVEDEDKSILQPYALMLACLQGNAFPQLIEQYMKEAKHLLISNGWWDTLRKNVSEKGT